jgi:hypothetical protein
MECHVKTAHLILPNSQRELPAASAEMENNKSHTNGHKFFDADLVAQFAAHLPTWPQEAKSGTTNDQPR